MCLFSVIIPVYNAGDYLKKCLASVEKQSFQDFEVILVCDGPKQDMQTCQDYAEKHANCLLIKNVNEGQGGARNAGIKAAQGDYIAFIDADDFIEPDFLEVLAQASSPLPDVLEFGYFNNDKKIFSQSSKQFFNFQQIIPQMSRGFVWNKLWKAEFLRQNQLYFIPYINYEDVAFCLKSAFYAKKWNVTDYAGYHYTYNPTSLSNNQQKEKVQKRQKDKVTISQTVIDFYKSQNCKAADIKIVEDFLISQLLENSDLLNKEAYQNYKKIFGNNDLFIRKRRKALRKWLFQLSFKKKKFILFGHSFWQNNKV